MIPVGGYDRMFVQQAAYHSVMAEIHEVPVRSGSSEQSWMLTTARRGRDWLLTLLSPGGESWVAEGPDLFKALRELRRLLDPLGIRLGVNGARRDSWASGMQCDMGEGRVVYILREGQPGRPAQVPDFRDDRLG